MSGIDSMTEFYVYENMQLLEQLEEIELGFKALKDHLHLYLLVLQVSERQSFPKLLQKHSLAMKRI